MLIVESDELTLTLDESDSLDQEDDTDTNDAEAKLELIDQIEEDAHDDDIENAVLF
jgi:hypothetical protein